MDESGVGGGGMDEKENGEKRAKRIRTNLEGEKKEKTEKYIERER